MYHQRHPFSTEQLWFFLSWAIPALETVAGVAMRRWLISKRSLIVGFRGILSLLARVSTCTQGEGHGRWGGVRSRGQLGGVWLLFLIGIRMIIFFFVIVSIF